MEGNEVKEKILSGAKELFIKFSVRSVTMDDIAHHLGISKKTLYQHFSDKDDIVFSATQLHVEQKCQEFEQIKAKAKNAVEELVMLSIHMKEQIKNINPSMLFDIHKYHHKAWNTWLSYRNRYVRESVIRNIKEGIRQGYYREEINAEIIATIRLELVQLGFDDLLFPRDVFNIAEVQMQLLEHFAYGLLTPKGIKLYQKYKDKTSTLISV